MLSFLRNIRRRLIDSGQLRKYLLYATGEILLVVIGILLALQINTWNESRKDRAAEINALNGLKQEYLNTRLLLEEKKSRTTLGFQNYRNFIQKITEGTATASDYLELEAVGNYEMGVGTTNPSFGVLNSLLSSGDINLIRNDSLKYLLTDWKDRFADFTEDEEIQLYFELDIFEPYRNSKVPISIKIGTAYRYHDYSEAALTQQIEALLADMQFRNFTIIQKAKLENLLPEIDFLLERIDLITRLIDEGLV